MHGLAMDPVSEDMAACGIAGAAAASTSAASASTESSAAAVSEPPLPPLVMKLFDLIHENWGSLGGACCAETVELQVAALNALIRSRRSDKVEMLLETLRIEGINVEAVGFEPPALLTLAKVDPFEGITDVRKALVDMGADPRQMYKGECAYDVARSRGSPMFY